jgi:LacI family transcriptional regulator
LKKTTLADVGKRAKVSTSLASLVLSGKYEGRCTPETAEVVRKVARDLGYKANRLARSLRKQSTRVLGLLSIEVATTPYAGEMIMAAQQQARLKDYDLLFVEVGNSLESIQEGLDLLAEHQAQGVLIFSYFHHAIDLPSSTQRNIVCANLVDSKGFFDSIVPNESDSFMQTLDLLGKAGHKSVAVIMDSSGHPASVGRLEAFKVAQEKYGWEKSDSLMHFTMVTNQVSGYEVTQKFLKENPQITAVVAFNDLLAMGVYQAAKELNIRIPEDLSIVGFDDLDLISAGLRPGLTTVRLPHLKMGQLAVEKLIQRCESENELPREKIEILCELIERQSIAAPRSWALPVSMDPAEKMQYEHK